MKSPYPRGRFVLSATKSTHAPPRPEQRVANAFPRLAHMVDEEDLCVHLRGESCSAMITA
jgi:hypothetical protein